MYSKHRKIRHPIARMKAIEKSKDQLLKKEEKREEELKSKKWYIIAKQINNTMRFLCNHHTTQPNELMAVEMAHPLVLYFP